MTDDLKTLAEAAKAATEMFNANPNVREAERQWDAAMAEFCRAFGPDEALALYRERDEARALQKHMLPVSNCGNYVFIDGPGDVEIDHGGELRARAEAAEASLSSAQEEVARLRDALISAHIDLPIIMALASSEGHEAGQRFAAAMQEKIDAALAALTQEPSHER